MTANLTVKIAKLYRLGPVALPLTAEGLPTLEAPTKIARTWVSIEMSAPTTAILGRTVELSVIEFSRELAVQSIKPATVEQRKFG